MALSAKLVMRQGQSLVMTPQLLQAIKLLQLSNVELASFIEEELERNPLLERADERLDPREPAPAPAEAADPVLAERDWTAHELATDQHDLEANLGTELGNAFEGDRGGAPASEAPDGHGLTTTTWNAAPAAPGAEATGPDSYLAAPVRLADVLADQLALAVSDPVDRLVGHALIDAIDEHGYLREPLDDLAARLGVALPRIEAALAVIQGFEPTGVGARDLAECLAIQLRERNRLDPAMQALLAHLPLLARRDFPALRKLCGVDDEDLRDMLAEIRTLDPKPGRGFDGTPVQTVIPDVFVSAAPDGSWHVELNTEVLPRVLVNQRYHARVSKASAASDTDKSFMTTCLQTANWLTKSLEQRARTILKVSGEIIRQQDGFFANGVEHLRPLNLRSVADAIGMHESTVSRVTSNKYMSTPRGLFELKYFFSASIPAARGSVAHSAEAVRFRIKQMIETESPAAVLSDDAIVARLKGANIDIARRTVAKYRESLRIPSSVERRRDKGSMADLGEPALSR